MSKLNAIEKKLLELGSGKFEKLSNAYFYKCGYSNLIPWGSKPGQDKTRTGIPDSYIPFDNGNYILIEYTTTKEGNVFGKYRDDLNKDLNKTKLGIPIGKIEEIWIFYNTELSIKQYKILQSLCESKNVILRNFGVTTIAKELRYKYPSIAKDFLGIQIDTEQITDLDDFILEASNRPFTPDFDNKFLFREKELKQLEESISKNIITVVHGKAGVGKTRLLIEACKQFIENNKKYKLRFIVDKSRDIYDDLVTYFAESDEKFLIFLDDANRQSAIDQILLLAQENPDRIKLIITVRDYAFDNTIKKINDYFEIVQPIIITEFTHSETQKLLNELSITNPLWIDRIWDISKGNARIAIMAASIGKRIDHISALSNIEDIYEKYFDSISNDLSEINLTVLGIISFFRIIDLKDGDLMQSIEHNFFIDKNDFMENSMTLHHQELVDMWEDEIVKISDQVLQTYIFYKSFIKDKLLDFSIILNVYYDEKYRENVKDLIYASLNSFDFRSIKNQLIPYLNEKLDSIKNDKNKLIDYYDLFWLLKPTETFDFINDEIRKLPANDIRYSGEMKSESIIDPYINILKKFINADEENFKISIKLLFKYIQRVPDIIPQILYYVENDISFKRFSYNLRYKQQLIFIKYIYEDLNSISTLDIVRLFAASHFSKIIYTDNWMTSKYQFTWTNFSLVLHDEIKAIRSVIWNYLIERYKLDEDEEYILAIFNNHLVQIRYKSPAEADIEVIKFDSNYILKFISCMNNSELKHCVFVHDYLNALNELEIKDTKVEKIKEEFSTYSYKLYQAFTKEFWKLKDYNESEKKKKELLISYVKDYSFEDYIKLFDDYAYVKKQITNKDWNITESLRIVLRHIFETEFNLFYELIKYLIQRKNFILLQSYFFISDMLSKDDIAMSEFYDLLKNNEYKLQEEWMISFFQFLPEEKITEFYYEELIDLLKSFDKFYLDLRLDFLEKYKQFDKNIYINVIKILYKKVKSGITNVNFHLLFNPNSEIFRKLDEIFNSDLTLFKEIYFYQKSKDIYSDHNSNVLKKILEQDSDFIIEYLDWMHEKKEHLTDMNDHSNYGSLWKATNYVEIFDKILNYLRNKFDFLFSSHHYINVFFLKHENDGISVRLDYLKRKFKESITDIKMIKLLFVIITNYFPTERLHFISVFTKHNPDIEIFKQLYLESDSQSGTATFVPVYTKRMEFWKLVQDSFSSVELLKHKRFAEEKIQNYQRSIKDEQRRNFGDDFQEI